MRRFANLTKTTYLFAAAFLLVACTGNTATKAPNGPTPLGTASPQGDGDSGIPPTATVFKATPIATATTPSGITVTMSAGTPSPTPTSPELTATQTITQGEALTQEQRIEQARQMSVDFLNGKIPPLTDGFTCNDGKLCKLNDVYYPDKHIVSGDITFQDMFVRPVLLGSFEKGGMLYVTLGGQNKSGEKFVWLAISGLQNNAGALGSRKFAIADTKGLKDTMTNSSSSNYQDWSTEELAKRLTQIKTPTMTDLVVSSFQRTPQWSTFQSPRLTNDDLKTYFGLNSEVVVDGIHQAYDSKKLSDVKAGSPTKYDASIPPYSVSEQRAPLYTDSTQAQTIGAEAVSAPLISIWMAAVPATK